MKLRRTISLTTFLSFIGISYTGIILFIVPQGRVAYWNDWHFLGLSKTQYSELHTTFMLLFLIGAIWHIVNNWKAIVTYLKNKKRQLRILTPEFVVALGLSLFFVVGTLAKWPPLSAFLRMGEVIKYDWEKNLGAPPWGHAEDNSLQRFCRSLQGWELVETGQNKIFDAKAVMQALQKQGIRVESTQQKIAAIAQNNKLTPTQLFPKIRALGVAQTGNVTSSKQAKTTSDQQRQQARFPIPMEGLGRMNLRAYAARYNKNLDAMLKIYKAQGLDLDPDNKLRDEAQKHGLQPDQLIEKLSGQNQ